MLIGSLTFIVRVGVGDASVCDCAMCCNGLFGHAGGRVRTGSGTVQAGCAANSPFDTRLLPGNPAPFGLDCAVVYHEVGNEFCDLGNIYLIINDGQITDTFVATYGSGLTIGDMLNEWGRPVGADYNPYSVSIYWSDRYAHVYIGALFTQGSRVGYVPYGKPRRAYSDWDGYANLLPK